MQVFAHVGIALATVVSAWLNCVMLAFMLRRRGYFAPDRQLKRRLPRVVVATVIMAAALWGLMHLLQPWLAGSGPTRLLAFGVLVVAGLVIYGAAALATGAADLKEARRLIGKAPSG
jgi:putative peptidoglycan lipid II flippase